MQRRGMPSCCMATRFKPEIRRPETVPACLSTTYMFPASPHLDASRIVSTRGTSGCVALRLRVILAVCAVHVGQRLSPAIFESRQERVNRRLRFVLGARRDAAIRRAVRDLLASRCSNHRIAQYRTVATSTVSSNPTTRNAGEPEVRNAHAELWTLQCNHYVNFSRSGLDECATRLR